MQVIYVDDEQPALENFKWITSSLSNVDSLNLFQDGEKAIEWAKMNVVDVAFLDMEMPDMTGIELARKLKDINVNIRIVFVTAYDQYALDAFGVDAIGYVLKPYTQEEIIKELNKASMMRPWPSQRVVIKTIPSFSVLVDGKALRLGRAKARELFALLVDRGERGITTGEGIAYLWPERSNDAKTQALFRVTYKRLVDALGQADIGYIIASKDNHRFICMDQVDCDLYRILSGDIQTAKKYDGQYMQEYSWAEERNGQLYRMLLLVN